MPPVVTPSRILPLGDQAVHHLTGDRRTPRVAAAVRVPRKGGDPARLPSRLVVCDAASGATGAAIKLKGLMAVAFTPDGQALRVAYRGGEGHALTRYELPTGRAGASTPFPWLAVLSPDGRWMAYTRSLGHGTTYEEDRTAEAVVSAIDTGEPVWRWTYDGFEQGECTPVAFLAGDRVLFRGHGRHMTLELSSGATSWRPDGYRIASPVYLPDGHSALDRPSPTEGLAVCNLENGLQRPLEGAGPSARLLATSPDGACALLADEQAGLGLWDVKTGARRLTLEPGCPPAHVTCAAFADEGRLVCLGTRDGRLLIVEAP